MLRGKLAKKKAIEFVKNKNLDVVYFRQWKIDNEPTCVFNKHSILLITKCNYDPMGMSKDLYVINYVFTELLKRREGYAKSLIDKLKNTGSSYIVFCSNGDSEKLFEGSGFTSLGDINGCPAYRLH